MASGDVIIKFKAEDMVTPEIKNILDDIYKLETRIKDLKADKKGILSGSVTSDIDSVKRLQVELEKLKEAYIKADVGSKTAAKNAVKRKEIELEAELTKAINREIISLKRKKDTLKLAEAAQRKNISAQEKSINASNRERIATDKVTASKKKEDAIRRTTMNTIVRHLRQVETLVIAYYTLSRVVDATVTKGIMLNKTIEDGTVGIAALIAANTEGGNSAERFSAAMAISADTVLDLKKASIDTAATFPQLTEVFQQAIGGALGAGKAMGATVDSIIQNTIKLSQRMTNIASSIGMPMEQVSQEIRAIMEGTITKDARIAKMLGITSKDIDEAKKGVGNLTKYLEDKLKVFDVLTSQKTFSRMVARFTDAMDTVRMEATKPLFNDLINEIDDATKYIKDNMDDWVDSFATSYYDIKAFFVYYEDGFTKISETIDFVSDSIDDLIDVTVDAINYLGDLFDVSNKVTVRVEDKALKDLYEELEKAKEKLSDSGGLYDTLFGTRSKKNLEDDVKRIEKKIAYLERQKQLQTDIGKITVEEASREELGMSGLSQAYKELNDITKQKFKTTEDMADAYTQFLDKYRQYPEIVDNVVNAVNRSISKINVSGLKLTISSTKQLVDLDKIAQEAQSKLSLTPEIDKLDEKYKPIFEKLNRLMKDSNKEIADKAKATAVLVQSAYNTELNKIDTKRAVEEAEKLSDAFLTWKSLSEISDEDLKQIQDNLKKESSEYLTYYETIGDYAKAWGEKEQQIRDEYEYLTPQELDKLVKIYKKNYLDAKYKAVKEEAKKENLEYLKLNGTIADGIVYQVDAYNNQLPTAFESGMDIMRDLTSDFNDAWTDFFDKQSDSWLDFGDLGKSILDDLEKQLIKTSVVQPLTSATTSLVGDLTSSLFQSTSTSSWVSSAWDSTTSWLSSWFDEGGYTAGMPNDKTPVGVVHANEYVINADMVRRHPALVAGLEAERRGLQRFDVGGFGRDNADGTADFGYGDFDGNDGGDTPVGGSFADQAWGYAKAIGNSLLGALDKTLGAGLTGLATMTTGLFGGIATKSVLGATGMDSFSGLYKGVTGKDFTVETTLDEAEKAWGDIENTTKESLEQSQASTQNTQAAIDKAKDQMDAFDWGEGDDKASDWMKNITQEQMDGINETLLNGYKADVIDATSDLWDSMIGVIPDLKVDADEDWTTLFNNYLEQGNDALVKVALDGTMFDTPDFYSIWEDYAESLDESVTQALTDSLATLTTSSRDFTTWSLGGDTTEALSYKASYLNDDLEALEQSMGVTGLSVENFSDVMGESLANDFSPENIDKWNQLSSAFMTATDAMEEFTNSFMSIIEDDIVNQAEEQIALAQDYAKVLDGISDYSTSLNDTKISIDDIVNSINSISNPDDANSSLDLIKSYYTQESKIIDDVQGVVDSFKEYAGDIRTSYYQDTYNTVALKQDFYDSLSALDEAIANGSDDIGTLGSAVTASADDYLGYLQGTSNNRLDYDFQRLTVANSLDNYEPNIVTLDDIEDTLLSISGVNSDDLADIQDSTELLNYTVDTLLGSLDSTVDTKISDTNTAIDNLTQEAIAYLGKDSPIVGWLQTINDTLTAISFDDYQDEQVIDSAYSAANTQLVKDTFNTVLDRDVATDEGLDYWTGQLDTGAISATNIDEAIATSAVSSPNDAGAGAEYLVEDAFSSILGRTPSAGGLDYWTNQIASGAISAANIDEAITASAIANGEIPAMADGGVVNGSTLTLLGEANYPEMVTPLKNPNDPLGSESILKELRAMRQVMEDQEQRLQKLQSDNSKMRKIMEREEIGAVA